MGAASDGPRRLGGIGARGSRPSIRSLRSLFLWANGVLTPRASYACRMPGFPSKISVSVRFSSPNSNVCPRHPRLGPGLLATSRCLWCCRCRRNSSTTPLLKFPTLNFRRSLFCRAPSVREPLLSKYSTTPGSRSIPVIDKVRLPKGKVSFFLVKRS